MSRRSSGLSYSLGGRDRQSDDIWSEFVFSGSTRLSSKETKISARVLSSHLKKRTAVYAIGPKSGPPMKIGFSMRPRTRLVDLQISSAEELKFHLVCWLPDRATATRLENRCHKNLTQAGLHIRGEWFNMNAKAAAKALDRAAIDIDCQLAPHPQLVKTFPLSDDPLDGCFWV